MANHPETYRLFECPLCGVKHRANTKTRRVPGTDGVWCPKCNKLPKQMKARFNPKTGRFFPANIPTPKVEVKRGFEAQLEDMTLKELHIEAKWLNREIDDADPRWRGGRSLAASKLRKVQAELLRRSR